nr:hypothetical protein [Sphingomonadaceae bacterium]
MKPLTDPDLAAHLRRLGFGFGMLLLLCLLVAPFFFERVASGAPRAVGGVVDYRGWGPLDRPVELAGDWRFEWHGAPGIAPFTKHVPGTWAGVR